MGQWARSGKTICESVKSIDVNRWHSGGYLEPGRWFGWHWTRDGEQTGSIQARAEQGAVVLIYRARDYDGDWEEIEQHIPLERTPCRFGGSRPWFVCSVCSGGRYCGRRVARLYGVGKLFACRHCYRLAYASQHEPWQQRGLGLAQKLRVKLGGDPAIDSPLPDKPPRMHWRTYQRVIDRIITAEERADAGLMGWLLRLQGSS